MLELVKELNEHHDVTVVAVLHDLNHAATIADHMVVLDGGRVVRAGPLWEALDEAILADVFGVDATIIAEQPAAGARRSPSPSRSLELTKSQACKSPTPIDSQICRAVGPLE